MRAYEFAEDMLNKNEYLRKPRRGARPKRGHDPVERYTSVSNNDDQQLDELMFMGMSPCKTDCSGHRAGYKWSKDRGGVSTASWSDSFNRGAEIAKAGY